MGLFDSAAAAGLSRVEWIERTLGPHAALPLLRPLSSAGDPAVRLRATLAIIRCSVRINDPAEVSAQSARWSELRGGVYLDDIIDLCKALLAQGHARAASDLAGAEAARDPKARAIYLHARCLERAGDASAMDVYKLAADRADVEPSAAHVGVAARVRRIERLARTPDKLSEAIAEAAAADPEPGTAADKLVIASVRLASPSRFTRAGALSLLEELARKGRAEIADVAIRTAARHADALADGLSPVEVDRLSAVLKHIRDPKPREDALLRLRALTRLASAKGDEIDQVVSEVAEAAPETRALLSRARAVLAGGGQGASAGVDDAAPDLRLAEVGLDLVVALRRGKTEDAIAALARATVLLNKTSNDSRAAGGAAPPPLWTGAYLALRSLDKQIQNGAIELCEVLINAPLAPPPPPVIKMAPLAALLRRAGRADLAARCLRGAAAAKEPGAAEDLAMDLLRHGWSLAARGERDAAIAALREARSLFPRPRRAG